VDVVPEQVDAGLQRVLDRSAIQDALARYARAVDRGSWAELWAVYHDDAYDDHVDYRGNVAGLIAWLEDRFAGVDNSVHLLGNCLIEFAGPDLALVETYFVSLRLRAPTDAERAEVAPGDAVCRESCGRYIDRFERRGGAWRIVHRRVVLDARFSFVAKGGARDGGDFWGARDGSDPLHAARALMFKGGG
jgi:hypothetical protein